jgi:hypothetical protein
MAYTNRASQREHQTNKKGWDQNQYRFVQAILQVTFFIIYFTSLIKTNFYLDYKYMEL